MKKHNYGGAFGIDEESFWSYEDMVELASQINDILESKKILVECDRCFVGNTDKELEADCVVRVSNKDRFAQKYADLDGATFTSFFTADFRVGHSPERLIARFAQKFADIIEQDFRDMCELELDVPSDVYMSTDIEDREPVYGDAEDYGFGFDQNGDPIDESTVDELCRITEEIVDDQLKDLIVYPFVQRDNFDYYRSGGAWGGTFSFDIDGDVTDKNINIYDFQLDNNESMVGFGGSAVLDPGRFSLSVRINVTNNSVSTDIWDVSVYDSDNRYSSYDTEKFFKCFDKEAIESYISEQVEPVQKEVAHTIFDI